MQGRGVALLILVPGVRDVFSDLRRIERLDLREIAAANDAGWQEQLRLRRVVVRIFAVDEVVADALTVPGPVLVEARDREQVRDVDARDEIARLRNELLESGDRAGVECGLAVRIDRCRHAADEKALQMRILAAEYGVHLDELALPVKRLEVVRNCHQVRFGRQLVSGVTPIRICEGAKLSPIDEPFDTIAHSPEVRGAR